MRRTALLYVSRTKRGLRSHFGSFVFLSQTNTEKRLYACLLSTDVSFTFLLQYKRTNECPIWDLFEQNETKPSIFTYYLSETHHQQISMATLRFDGKINASCFVAFVFFRHLKTSTATRFVNNATASKRASERGMTEQTMQNERWMKKRKKKAIHDACNMNGTDGRVFLFFLSCFDLLAIHLFHERE